VWQFKTLWEIGIDIDKMWGLLATHKDHFPITLWAWDTVPSEIFWDFKVDQTIVWEWVLFTKEKINSIFKPFQEDWITPTPFRLRPWSLWRKRKRKWLIRLQEVSDDIIRLIHTNWWWEELEEINKSSYGETYSVTLNWKVIYL